MNSLRRTDYVYSRLHQRFITLHQRLLLTNSQAWMRNATAEKQMSTIRSNIDQQRYDLEMQQAIQNWIIALIIQCLAEYLIQGRTCYVHPSFVVDERPNSFHLYYICYHIIRWRLLFIRWKYHIIRSWDWNCRSRTGHRRYVWSNWSWRHFCHARGFRFLQITPRLSSLFHSTLIRWLAPCMGTAASSR